MLARTAQHCQLHEILHDDRYALDVKADGERRLIHVAGGTVTLIGRDGQTPTRFPLSAAVLKAFARLTGGPFTFDAELIPADGRLWLFDMPRAGTLITPDHGWSVRRTNLTIAYDSWNPGPSIRLVPYATGTDAKIALIERVAAGRGEGVMAKLVTSKYRPGKSRDWLKIKRRYSVDCVVTWIGTEKQNMGVGLWRDGTLEPVPVAEVGRTTGDGARVREGDVVEVTFQYVSDDNHLVQPTLPRIRNDKLGTECTWDQLEECRSNRTLLATWGTT